MNHKEKEILGMLDLAGAELNVFAVGGVGLCFGFFLEPTLIIQECFSYCWVVLTESGAFLLLTPPHQQSKPISEGYSSASD